MEPDASSNSIVYISPTALAFHSWFKLNFHVIVFLEFPQDVWNEVRQVLALDQFGRLGAPGP